MEVHQVRLENYREMTLADDLALELERRKRMLLVELMELAEERAGKDWRSKGSAMVAVAAALKKVRERRRVEIGFR